MSLSKNIKYLREAAGHTQKELGQFLSVERTTISSYERGIRQPGSDIISRIAQLYGVSLDSLMYDDYDTIGFMPPVYSPPKEAAKNEDSLSENPSYCELPPPVPMPREKQMDKKMEEVYHKLGYEDRLMLIQIGIRLLLSGSRYQDQPIPEKRNRRSESCYVPWQDKGER